MTNNNNTTDTEHDDESFSFGFDSISISNIGGIDTKTIALAVVALVVASSVAMAAPSGITAGSTTSGMIEITAEDDSIEQNDTVTRGVYFEVNNQGSNIATVDSVTVYDADGNEVANGSLSVDVSPGSSAEFTTRSSSGSGANTLGVDVPERVDNNATLDVAVTQGPSTQTITLQLDLDADDDGVTDSLDAYPLTAPTTHDLTVNTSEGTPSQLSITVTDGQNTVEFEKYNSSTDEYEAVKETTVGAMNETETATYDISGAEDGQQYRIVSEGMATVDSTQVLYDTASGGGSDGGDGSSDGALVSLPAVPDIPTKFVVGGGAVAVVVAALYVLRDDY
ncbi:hypothetical protein B4589_009855 [Halolamina sp. CBA1230]|uniref:hypothetical protein n=1 Tax=Halolamina sp. CBA1230 TaxID=1853690 RepID=UPI0009A24633|nr:hypothetical protein [Halolamina sp. CBA1230]QKY20668.1 hypothetical protein B4589_009855 [Halolamina sp. CBA1230]